jgi:hypothetical protein
MLLLMKLALPLFLCSALAFSCTSDNPIETDGAMMPVVTGLRVTWGFGPKQELQWGNPLYPNVDGIDIGKPTPIPSPVTEFLFYNPYPNPAKRAMSVRIDVPEHTNLRCWLTSAYLQGEDASTQYGSSIVYQLPQGKEYLVKEEELNAGRYEFWIDRAELKLPAGLYRVYVLFDNRLQWRDVWFYDILGQLPEPLYGHAMLSD